MSSIDISNKSSGHQVPEAKQTTLGLYVTAKEADAMQRSNPDNVFILDVRTPEEYIYVGHAEAAQNIPVAFTSNTEKNEPTFKPNAEFVSSVKNHYQPNDTILVTCRSGGRSALAVNMLAQAGFTNAYNIIDGMEGDKVNDPDSVHHGKRMKNGWKNSGADWTYDINPARLWIQ